MTKAQQLADIAEVLTEEQLDGVLAYARYLRGRPYHETASPEALASIERGLADQVAGRVRDAADVFAEIDRKIARRGG